MPGLLSVSAVLAAVALAAPAAAHGGEGEGHFRGSHRGGNYGGGPHRLGFHDRMEVARGALRAAGMDLSWDSSAETGRSVVFTAPAAGSVDADGSTPLLSVQCIAADPSFAKETDVVVLVAAPGAAPVRCGGVREREDEGAGAQCEPANSRARARETPSPPRRHDLAP
jgi:hypothetical protein